MRNQPSTPLHTTIAGQGSSAPQYSTAHPAVASSETELNDSLSETKANVAGSQQTIVPRPQSSAMQNNLLAQMRSGSNASQATASRQSALKGAIRHGASDIFADLLADPAFKPNHDCGHGTALCMAALYNRVEMAKALLNVPEIDCNKTGTNQYTPLYIAARHGHVEFVQVLLEVDGVDGNLPDKDGSTPLHIAAQFGHANVLKALLAEASINSNKPRDDGFTALHVATHFGHAEIAEILLSQGKVDANSTNNDGDTPLHIAMSKGHVGVMQSLLKVEELQYNLPNKFGETPLHAAAWNGSLQVVQTYLKKATLGAEAYAMPIALAAVGGHITIVQALRKHQALHGAE